MITINLSGFEVMRTRGTPTDADSRLRESLEESLAALGAEIIGGMRRSLVLDIDDSGAIDGAYTVKSETREPTDEPAPDAPQWDEYESGGALVRQALYPDGWHVEIYGAGGGGTPARSRLSQ